MALPDFLTTRDVAQVFAEEIEALRGRVSDRFDDAGCRLFLRSILPEEREVRRRDRLQGGVAVMASEVEIRVHPYVFRQVCSNGAIRCHAVQTRTVAVPSVEWEAPDAILELRDAVRACAQRAAFVEGVEEMRSTLAEQEVDVLLTLMPMLANLRGRILGDTVRSILSRAMDEKRGGGGGRGATRFAWMNAVTSVARDARDPELRWRLEEIGGGVPVMTATPTRRRGAARKVEVLVPA
jgi:hypothetical protein